MALSSATISYDIADLVGNDFDSRSIKIRVSTNVQSGIISDTVGNQIRVGDGRGTISEDGTGSVSVWVPGTGSNPTTWQTYVHLDYSPRRPGGPRVQERFGPFTITGDANLADLIQEQEIPPTYLSTVTTLLDAYVTEAEAARDDAVSISGISTSDAVVGALVAGTGGAGPLTRGALAGAFAPTELVTPAYRGTVRASDPPISRAGAFAGLARWMRSMTVRPISGTAGLSIVTDSTGTDTSAGDGPGWPSRLAAQLAASLGDITIRFRYFDHASTLKMLPPTSLKESTLGRPRYAIGTNPSNYLTAPYGRSGLAAAGAILTGDIDLRVKLDAKAADIAGQTIELVCNYGPGTSAAERGVEFYKNSTEGLSIRTAVGGSSITLNSTAALTWVDDVSIWLRAVLIKDNGATGKTAKFYYSTNDGATWTQLGADVTQAGVLGTINSPAWHWEVGTRGGGTSWNLVITGTPTGGAYKIKFFPDNASTIIDTTLQTADIAYNADAATVQAAIRAVTGHAAFATAVVTGTWPSFNIAFTIPVRYAQTTHTLTGGTTPGAALGGAWGIRKINVYEVEIRNGINGPAYGPTNSWDWDVSPSRVGYLGGPMLDIVNFAYSGHALPNFNAAPYKDIATVDRSTLALILATGHNEGQVKGPELVTLLEAFRTYAEGRLPTAAFAVLTENPEVSPSVVDQFQALRASQLATYAARHGWSVIDTFTAFLDDPRWSNVGGGTLLNDDRHPSTLAHQTILEPLVRRAILSGS